MALNDYITTFGDYLKEKYRQKVYKLSLQAEMTCPNRDGSKGIGGCTFCNNKSFFPADFAILPIPQQIDANVVRLQQKTGAKKFIAYFQAYSNTYGEIQTLQRLYLEALQSPNVIGLCIGTRPDCLSNEVMELLVRIQDAGYEVWVELGLQSSHDKTLDLINRGHSYSDYSAAVHMLRSNNLKFVTHLIVGLPGENKKMVLESWDRVLQLGVGGVKWHPLHVVKGTQLARQWKQGFYRPIERDDYIDIVGNALQQTPKEVIVHRTMSTVTRKDLLLAPQWTEDRWPVIYGLETMLKQRKDQTHMNHHV